MSPADVTIFTSTGYTLPAVPAFTLNVTFVVVAVTSVACDVGNANGLESSAIVPNVTVGSPVESSKIVSPVFK